MPRISSSFEMRLRHVVITVSYQYEIEGSLTHLIELPGLVCLRRFSTPTQNDNLSNVWVAM